VISRDYNRLQGASLNSAQESFKTNSVILNRNDPRIFENKVCERTKEKDKTCRYVLMQNR